ncbi:flagellar export protein FliJ [Leptospira sp. 2 VSF19]|uniref:Flagellar FliJ protein n=1 Tax=Leptospira soteropolitanensis TaxID=2950025 RepID=A0AAW5VJX4_9LEPT|nr:flagellar export protein FliJ [Leptospira soteropolitanensis]MCW7493927.1 flagellar export protein FliJ [Leptospira soteropolitanensis]MCW7501521.1 flagellar export protein FliJ [Leptospira soteropolitanensis]MCW7523717.1 flagellar export protein FliJ [Leptospira soteropolitanensis]MCW7527580.1 flagellar export protein FliJ [Leptospira soteropolitanensis]MCW7531434.1 flagellar export protein FliJ [Leptospira soteropolitanensis]
MKRFRFSLETVLKLRGWREEEEIRRLSLVVSKLNSLIGEKESNEKEIESSYNAILNSSKVGTSLSDYLSIEQYIQGLIRRNEDLEARIFAQNEEVNLVRKDVMVARMNKKVIEVLKDKRFAEWKKKRNRAERREVEEFNLQLSKQSLFDLTESFTPAKSKKIPRTFKILNREDGGDELTSDFKTLRDFYEKYYLGKGKS